MNSSEAIGTNSQKTVKTLIVLGSGGHTMEMCEVIKKLDKTKYTPRIYILAKSDKTSRSRIEEIEDFTTQNQIIDANDTSSVFFVEILRSRTVNQSYLTSIITTLLAIIQCIPLCWRIQPDLIICNGPSTCVPICLVAFILKSLRCIRKCKIVFIESYCRVETLSLSGKILLRIVDMFVVQWPDLLLIINGGKQNRSNVKYFGRLM